MANTSWADKLAEKSTDKITEAIAVLKSDIHNCKAILEDKGNELDLALIVLEDRLTDIRSVYLPPTHTPPKASGSEPEAYNINMIESVET
ncbi:hypothetical protein H8D85_00495 [bacterium]|nr:hypothetical protein [bacterium]